MNQHTYVAIMAGGIGSRFWPASREERPKQFLDILGAGKSLIRLTFERFLKICPADHIYIVTNGRYKELVKEHLPEIGDHQILCEPSRNNTAPCVAYTAFKLAALDPTANMIVAPSDHIILNEDAFVQTINKACTFVADKEALLTLGIQPIRPDTGYGYIHFTPNGDNGIHKVEAFMEKPVHKKAKEYLASGEYLWNAGIFIWNVQSILKAFDQYAHDIYQILGAEPSVYNTADEQPFIDRFYPTTPSISIDYAIMEKSDQVYTIPSNFGWSDLGTWASLHAESKADENGNVINGNQVYTFDTQNCLIRIPKDKTLVIKDLDDFIIVDEEDVLLIYPKSKEQEIKGVVEQINK